ncbi:DEAD/DEAH box helicase family protein [Pseudomonas aeruginosa]|uniref:DEAD/DEAH box helicase n=1 Tax=Pseudomonas aeruginosa TaxID=287 RepID=UPI000DFDC2C0|nr:type ISP restriction/modification enzyme [Pseudomonas aeruginosa]MBH8925027.1 DEAD/DEAH box helicase [Pseudomonas aeruginosa]MBS9738233.1 DEAD/DEAH box helicase [Pseudomonas aeruginosa]MCS7808415.1 DEAD/DEAH box helicase family protein [Pseudomonas aeruginosa]MCS7839874.1 DEAD/DEAH box helicase family protein [Pseudomonas aeruginosa]MCS9251014.1 DEAD/DEAH box helicase family protein [Pseudomonas aeruginosa]
MTTLNDILSAFRDAARSNREMGDKFERLIAAYLLADPQFSDRLADVWLWSEWPDRSGMDVGIDLVARERGTGDYWAIQCKFYDPGHTLQKADIDSFFTASGKRFATSAGERFFSHRLIISTTDKWSSNAEKALENQTIPVSRLWFKDLADSPVDWSLFDLARVSDIRLQKKKDLMPHQATAIESVLSGFESVDRGKLVMACGTGKTFTSLRLMEQATPENGLILFLAPSISLVGQSLREWSAQAEKPFHAFVVCSDSKVGKDEEDISAHDLAYPATTDTRKIIRAASVLSKDRRTVIFSTYQSIQVVADAQKQGLGRFDLIVCDEAHRTTGLTLPGESPSEFVKVHHDENVSGAKRLYMTATPRIFADASKTKANNADAALFSMDDEATFGPEFYRLGFGKAVELDLLSEYKVLIVAVREAEMAKLANNFNNAFRLDEKKAIDINFATKIIGSWKGLSKRGLVSVGEDGQEEALVEDVAPMRRAVAFSKSIKLSRQTTEIFKDLVGVYKQAHDGDESDGMVRCDLEHVDGTMNALKRKQALDWLKADAEPGECRILSNARCLSEGIDVPTLDAVVFFDTRESIVDIVQSVGRVMRKDREGRKKYGYIILPVCMPSEKVKDYNAYIDGDPQFKGIWKVIKALRAHDESLVDEAEFRRRISVVDGGSGKTGDERDGSSEMLPLDFPDLPIDAINEAVYAAIPKKLGDREYWSEWAKSIALVSERLIARIESLLASDAGMADEFEVFLKGLKDTLNPAVSRSEAVEMLAQHILTLPVFQALFAGSHFPDNNVVAKALQKIVSKLDAAAMAGETEGLEKFYQNVRERISLAKSDKSKQDIIRNLYDTFFHNAFPRMAERLGIVYTPVELVDFILKSADEALRTHFGESLDSEGVQILDPFAGTGTFFVRLLQSDLISPSNLERKFERELHANEIVLLAYYVATVNLETAFHLRTGTYRQFAGMVLTDTFQMTEDGDLVDKVVLPENNAKAERQLAQPIKVIVGNPPYSGQQESEGDNNKNLDYPTLDASIRNSYGSLSSSKLAKSNYDSYMRAIRWATERITDKGVIAFVTNGSFIDAKNMDGVRKSLVSDFSHLYVFNLRGNQYTTGEVSRREAGQIFGSLSRTPIAITVMVKDPAHEGPCNLYYHDIGDYLPREEKLKIIESFGSTASIPWKKIVPNEEGDWINQRDPAFEKFLPLGDKNDEGDRAVFSVYSLGVVTNRDPWTYGMSRSRLTSNVHAMIEAYEETRERFVSACKGKSKDQWPEPEAVIEANPKRISWTRALKADLRRHKPLFFDESSVVVGAYRPFNKQWMYFNRRCNEMVYQMPRLFPTPRHRNVVISSTGVADRKGYSALVADQVPNLHITDTGQCFPLYWFEKAEESGTPQSEMFSASEMPDADGYIRRDAISDWALEAFRSHYGDATISKEDIFWCVYGVLHSPEYKRRFASDLKKMLPRVPLVENFRAFSDAGRKLGDLHLTYEKVEPFPLTEDCSRLVMEPDDYRVSKMVFGKKDGKPDRTVIVFNAHLTLRDVPLEAYEYVVNGKSAIEWIMERYQVSVDPASGIKNDPNDWCTEHGDPRYILDLLKRIVRVSIESQRLVKSLPPLNEHIA